MFGLIRTVLRPRQSQAMRLAKQLTLEKTNEDKVEVIFVEESGKKAIIKTEPGKTLYDVVMDNNMDFDGFGSCGATLCCTTCHLIINEPYYSRLTPPNEEELNMLDLADGLCDTSRLGCQVVLPKGMESIEVQVPANLTDARAS